MPSLAETQARFRAAIVSGGADCVAGLLTGGADPLRRLVIHQRHYRASLAGALRDKFPATAWLMGAPFVAAAANAFVRTNPPARPCIAEYGAHFPAALAAWPGAERAPYLRDFAVLEWHVGHAAVAISLDPIGLDALSDVAPDRLPDLVVALQPGVRYLAAAWPVDELLGLYLRDEAPDRYAMTPTPVLLELRGARGGFGMARLDPATFAFRSALCGGADLALATEAASAHDGQFDVGAGLVALFGEGLAVSADLPPGEMP